MRSSADGIGCTSTEGPHPFPALAFWAGYLALVATNDPRAPEFLLNARRLLQQRAATLPTPAQRQVFLEHIPEHRALLNA